VVGSRGFVGSGVLRLLQRAGHEPVELDYGDDLRQVRDVDVIISTTGRAGLLHPEHLHRDHRLVIDSGFVPHPAGPVGDVHPSAAGLPRAVTPVPGGNGPVEMATLAERLVIQVAATELASWRYLARGREAETGLALYHKHTTAELTGAAERDRAVEAGHERARTREQDLGYDAGS
jgi:methylenetetrahydrofolate dehydrogenase (NADP+)/methenyltetrahydrofolate cyclohydrolase